MNDMNLLTIAVIAVAASNLIGIYFRRVLEQRLRRLEDELDRLTRRRH